MRIKHLPKELSWKMLGDPANSSASMGREESEVPVAREPVGSKDVLPSGRRHLAGTHG